MEPTALADVVRASVLISSVAFGFDLFRKGVDAGLPARRTAAVLVPWGAVTLAFSTVPVLIDTLAIGFPVALVTGLALALGLGSRPAVLAAAGRLSDDAVRSLLLWRGLFGALLLAGAACGRLPTGFALSAGLGDLGVAWLASTIPARIAPLGSAHRGWATLLHGVGVLDLLHVVVLAATVVRPWARDHGVAVDFVILPAMVVPLMLSFQVQLLRGLWRGAPDPVTSAA